MNKVARQVGRDLEWAVNSPSLLEPPQHQITKIDSTTVNSNELEQILSRQKNFRVGRYFESLVKFWIESVQGCEIVEYQKQLFEGTRTIGEIDFLYRNLTGELTHLETAVKFYLHYAGEHPSGSHFIGPNPTDSFEQKCQRLFDRQMKLGQQFYPEVSRVEAFVKGRIFYHPQSPIPTQFPERLSSQHLRGIWIHANELQWLDTFDAETHFLIQQKPHWLANELTGLAEPNLKSREDLRKHCQNHFLNSIRPLLIAAMETQHESHQERTRFFIVSENWPNG